MASAQAAGARLGGSREQPLPPRHRTEHKGWPGMQAGERVELYRAASGVDLWSLIDPPNTRELSFMIILAVKGGAVDGGLRGNPLWSN